MNRSRSPVTLALSVEAPFSAPATLTLKGGEVAEVPVAFAPTELGPSTGTLRLDQLITTLSGEGVAVPSCTSASTCRVGRFDETTLACVFDAQPDGSACGSAVECVDHGQCRSGVCEGAPKVCDDGNACTLDACAVGVGCTSVDNTASCPAPNTPCLAAVCDPVTGCGVATVADGTPCGVIACTTANVCLAGQCKAVTPPDGFECASATACQGPSVCRNRACEAPPPRVLTARATYAVPANPSFPHQLRFDGVSDAQHNWYWVECGRIAIRRREERDTNGRPSASDEAPFDSSCTAVSATDTGLERFRTPIRGESMQHGWTTPLPGQQLLTGGLFIFVMVDSTVAAVDAETGAFRWKRDFNAPAMRVGQLADDGHGTLWVQLIATSPTLAGATTTLELVTPATGVIRTTTAPTTPTVGLLLDEAGNAFTSSATSRPLWVSHDSQGRQRFAVAASGSPRLSVGEVVMGDDRLVLSSTTGATVTPRMAPLGQRAGVASAPLDWFSVGGAFVPDNHVRHSSGSSLSLGSRQPSGLWLTAARDALFVTFTTDDGPHPAVDVIQLTASGERVMQCSLDVFADAAQVGFNGRTLAVAATNLSIRFYDVGALGLAAHGWVTPRGRPEGTGQAR